jgi:hypothetical protein
MKIQNRFAAIDWDRISADLDERGWAITGPLLSAEEREALIAAYEEDRLFRSTVVMARHGFGKGEYRYFSNPLPDLIGTLRKALYARLIPVANRWRERLGKATSCRQSIRSISSYAMPPARRGRRRCCFATGRATTIVCIRISTAT